MSQLHRDLNLPVYKHAATAIQTLLDELVGGREVLEQVLVFDVIHLDYMMAERAEQVPVKRHAQDGQHVGDVGVPESVTPAQGEDAIDSSAPQTRETRTGEGQAGMRTRRCRDSSRPGLCPAGPWVPVGEEAPWQVRDGKAGGA